MAVTKATELVDRPPGAASPRRRGWRIGLLGRIAAALVLVGLVPLGVLASRLAGLNRTTLEDQTLQTHAVVARSAGQRLEALLEGLRVTASSTAGNPAFYRDPHSAAAADLLAGLLEAQPSLLGVVVVNAGGEEVVRAQHRDRAPVVDAVTAAGGGPVEAVEAAGETWLRLTAELPEGAGRLHLVSSLEPLRTALGVPELGASAELLLASKAGGVIAGPRALLAGLPAEILEAAGSGRLQGAVRDVSVDGTAFLGAFAGVEGSPWFVLSMQPSTVAEALSRRLARETLLAVAAAALLAAAVSAGAYRGLVRPIRGLLAAQRRLAGIEAAGGGDEIEELQRTFDLLERRVREKEALGRVALGRYEVVEVLGEGAMGTVFRSWDPRLQRVVALKTVRLAEEVEAGARSDLLRRLADEAVLAAGLQHENIVGVYDLITAGDLAFMAMELVDGVDLGTYLSRKAGRLETAEVAALGLGIARGLAAAHARGVVHHDVKPSNVLLGADGAIKLADFGISSAVSAVVEENGMVFGTPGYLPPETLCGRGYTPSGDLFALGVILFEALTGVVPYAGTKTQDILENTLAVREKAVTNPHLPTELRGLVLRLLEPEPSARPGSAEEVAEELERLRLGERRWMPELPPSRRWLGGAVAAPSRLVPKLARESSGAASPRGAAPV